MRTSYFVFVMTLLAFYIPTLVSGQTWSEKSIQLDINSKDFSSYQTLEFPSKGLLVLREGNKRPGKHLPVICQFYDLDLEVKWTRNLSIHRHYELIGETLYEDKAYLLAQNSKDDFLVFEIDTEQGRINEYAFDNIERVNPTHFVALKNHIIIGGHDQGHPTAIIFDTKLHKKSILPSLHQLKAKLVEISYHPEVHSFTVVSKTTQGLKPGIHFNTYWEDGRLQNNFWLEDTEDYNLHTFRPFLNKEHKLVVLGTYGLKSSKQVQGIYSLNFSEEGQFEDMKFYDFGYFKNFYQHLSEKRRNRLAKKIDSKRKKGKIHPLRHNFYLYDLKFDDDQVVLVAEEVELNRPSRTTQFHPNAFPYNNTASTMALQYTVPLGMYNSSLYNRNVDAKMYHDLGLLTEQVFPSEIRYKQLIACGFDRDGNLRWDNAFLLENQPTSIPQKHADILLFEDQVSIIEALDDKLRFAETKLKKYADSVQVQEMNFQNLESKEVIHRSTSQWNDDRILIISEGRKLSSSFTLRPQKWLIIRSVMKKDQEET
ncbi:hypothetical protein [Sediminitomix flava]|uniref:Uncharacterized protein n=1 Tax=Sediminitomix flava TaxID=379075 RepID=A0A315YX46_SEDFL|nr:hypothetical protein [Sediminitomix flava]PWJ34146.1 hypothetical protein BC781_11156 [Sediminitomix flava]